MKWLILGGVLFLLGLGLTYGVEQFRADVLFWISGLFVGTGLARAAERVRR